MENTFKIQMEAFHERMIASGKTLTSYVCPHCSKTLQTVQPEQKQVSSKGFWDSLKRCYECNQPSFVAVYPDGKVIVEGLDVPQHLA